VHLRTPALEQGFDHSNPLRVESAEQAAALDAKIAAAWAGHPRRIEVASTTDFLQKARVVLEIVRDCRGHDINLTRR
jgi:hypothetical protein